MHNLTEQSLNRYLTLSKNTFSLFPVSFFLPGHLTSVLTCLIETLGVATEQVSVDKAVSNQSETEFKNKQLIE